METIAATNSAPELFYDPFAEEGEEMYDADALHVELAARYLNKEIEHDYTTDNFVKDTETAMMTAHYKGQFAAMQSIMQRMHEICGEDHNLQQQMNGSEALSVYDRHNKNDGHTHAFGYDNKKSSDKKEDKKKSKKKMRLSLFEIMQQARKSKAAKAKKK
jgi:hypothetical protein